MLKLRVSLPAWFALLLAGALVQPAWSDSAIRYSVSIQDPARHTLHVDVTVPPSPGKSFRVAIPAWTPGYYQILNFSKDISGFKATDSRGNQLAFTQPDSSTWEITQGRGPATCSYDVKADDSGFGFFRSHVDDHTGYMNGASALMYLVGEKDRPAAIACHVPAGWKVACPLAPDGTTEFKAASYDELIDCPVQMGAFENLDFISFGLSLIHI